MYKQLMVYPHSAIPFSNKKEPNTDTRNNIDKSKMHYINWKEPDSKGYTLYDSIYIGKGKIIEQKTKPWLLGLGVVVI